MSNVINTTTTAAAPAAKATIVDTIKGWYTWSVSRLPTKKQLAYGLVACALLIVACALLIGGLGYYVGSQDGGRPESIVENARARFTPLASADDGVASLATAARDGVDSLADKVAAYLGW